MSDPIIDSLRRAVEAAPNDLALRLHLAERELADGQTQAAITSISTVLAVDAGNASAQALMMRAIGGAPVPTAAPGPVTPSVPENPGQTDPFDWHAAESDLGSTLEPAFVKEPVQPVSESAIYSSERSLITLADVGGMVNVKERLIRSFLAPLQNPGLRQLYGKSLRGGLLMYGPPGCGKTYIARAVAGELRASFLPIRTADVLDPYFGQSERNLHELFQQARRDAPCVLFLDELDTLGQRRRSGDSSMMRNLVNQLLTELDGMDAENDGVFALAATNQPWQIDPALRRPGRFDRTVLVLPPDRDARKAIFRHHLSERPVEGLDLDVLADRTDGLTGADIAYVCEVASENVLMECVSTGEARMIQMKDLLSALGDVRPSIGGWLESARNVVTFGEDDGTFEELRAYLKKAKRL